MANRDSSDKSLPTLFTELVDLVRAYAKQETLEPFKGLIRYALYGVVGSLVIGIGVLMFAMALLRALQTETDAFDGNWSWVPYVITVVLCGAVIAFALSKTSTKKARSES